MENEVDILHELEGACECTLEPTVANIEKLVASCARAHTEIAHLRKSLEWANDTPQIADFIAAVQEEIPHQRKRWGMDHDETKAPFDWVALAARLQGKMVEAVWADDRDKFLHHTITLAAVMANCHAANKTQ